MKTFSGEDIKLLIPQRFPMMMVSTFEATGEESAATTLTIAKDNYFLLPGGDMSETGLIEHIAQSASALAGYKALQAANGASAPDGQNVEAAPVGLIGEVKHFTCHRRARQGETVSTTVEFTFTFGSASLLKGESRVGDELIAEADMKIFLQ